MNIEINELAQLIKSTAQAPSDHPMIGKYVICRCYSAGVHAGVLKSVAGERVELTESRRLWSWTAKSGVALSGVAANGIDTTGSRVDSEVNISLSGVIEIIATKAAAEESIRNA